MSAVPESLGGLQPCCGKLAAFCRCFDNDFAAPQPATPSEPSEPMYPCADCGILRTKAEGGTTFTVCDECWEKFWGKPARAPLTVSEEVRERAAEVVWQAGSQTWGERWEDAHALRRPSTVNAFVIVDAVLAVLRSGCSEVDK